MMKRILLFGGLSLLSVGVLYAQVRLDSGPSDNALSIQTQVENERSEALDKLARMRERIDRLEQKLRKMNIDDLAERRMKNSDRQRHDEKPSASGSSPFEDFGETGRSAFFEPALILQHAIKVATLKVEYENTKKLFDKNVISKADLMIAETAFRSNESALRFSLSKLQSQKDSHEATLNFLRQQADIQKEDFDRLTQLYNLGSVQRNEVSHAKLSFLKVQQTIDDVEFLLKQNDMLQRQVSEMTGLQLPAATDSELSRLPKSASQAAVEVFENAKAESEQKIAISNLKQITVAVYSYEAKNGHFPPAILKENDVERSWRVELLPFLAQQKLYDQYRKEEPWNSPANLKVAEQMPAVYGLAKDGLQHTHFLAVLTPSDDKDPQHQTFWNAGPDEPFVEMKNIPDGASSTIMLIQSDLALPWTLPGDLTLEFPQDNDHIFVETLITSDEMSVAMADGSTKQIPKSIATDKLRAMFTRAGGELVE